ncbi:hypothetical protein EDD85DRAFT_781660, partial [Armillaria nabsnona]
EFWGLVAKEFGPERRLEDCARRRFRLDQRHLLTFSDGRRTHLSLWKNIGHNKEEHISKTKAGTESPVPVISEAQCSQFVASKVHAYYLDE